MASYGTAMPAAHPPQLARRKPTGLVRPPLIVIEGPTSSGKSTEAARFTSDKRLGESFWIELGGGDEGIGDEYAAMPEADYTLLEHDGTFFSYSNQILAARAEAARVKAAGGPPVSLTIDTFSTVWDQVKDWTYARAAAGLARQAEKNKQVIDPDAEINPGRNLWNDARDRYRWLMTQLLSFPGPVVLTVRGDWVSGTDDKGRPTTVREYSLEAHKSLKYDATVRIRLAQGEKPQVVKCRSVHAGINTADKPKTLTQGLDLGWLVFDVMKYDPKTAPDVVIREGAVDELPVPEQPPSAVAERSRAQADGTPKMVEVDWDAALAEAGTDRQQIEDLWHAAKAAEAGPEVAAKIIAAGQAAKAAAEQAGGAR